MPGQFRFPSNTRLAAILVDIVGSSSDLLLHFARNERVPVYLNRQIRFRRGNFQMKGSQPLWLRIALTSRRLATSFVQIIGEAFQTYGRINGEQCAASFAYYAFFSLFPLILLLVVVGTFFIPDRLQAAVQVVKQVEEYVPLQAKDKAILVDTIVHTIQNGWSAGIFGILALVWGGLRFFQALVIGVNRAWGFKDYNWWKLPLKNLFMIGILISALVLGLIAPLIFNGLQTIHYMDLNLIIGGLPMILPPAILFYGLLMFYKFAPRRSARFSQVWIAALLATLFLELGQNVFAWYLVAFSSFDALYGVFGTIMGLLLWIYFSGVILLLGGCMAATIHRPHNFHNVEDSIRLPVP
jgi:YihY family inner membrane protein